MLGMISSSLERNILGVRLMSGPGSERCSHTGAISRISSHWRNSLGLLPRSQLEVRLSTASSDKDAWVVMSHMVRHLCLRGRRCPRVTCCLCPSGASLRLFHGFGDQLGSLPSLPFPAASCFTPSDVGSGSFCYVCLVLISWPPDPISAALGSKFWSRQGCDVKPNHKVLFL